MGSSENRTDGGNALFAREPEYLPAKRLNGSGHAGIVRGRDLGVRMYIGTQILIRCAKMTPAEQRI